MLATIGVDPACVVTAERLRSAGVAYGMTVIDWRPHARSGSGCRRERNGRRGLTIAPGSPGSPLTDERKTMRKHSLALALAVLLVPALVTGAEDQLRLRQERELCELQDLRAQGRNHGRPAAHRRSHRRGDRSAARGEGPDQVRESGRVRRLPRGIRQAEGHLDLQQRLGGGYGRVRMGMGRRLGRRHDHDPGARHPGRHPGDRHRRCQEVAARLARHGRQGSRHAGQAREARQEHQRARWRRSSRTIRRRRRRRPAAAPEHLEGTP